jgi:hypothetical protein
MADSTYQIGDAVPLEATFRNAAGTPTNPSAVTLTVRAPDGTITTPTPTNTGPGVWHYDLSVTQPGLWWYTFKGTGTVQAADRRSFYVQNDWTTTAGPLGPHALVTLEEAREYVLESVTDNSQDHKLVRRINAYSEAVWQYTRREWTTTTGATRVFQYRGYGMLSLAPYDLRTATAVVAFTDLPTTYQVTLAAGTTTAYPMYELKPAGGTTEGTYRWLDPRFGLQPFPYISEMWDGWPPTNVTAWNREFQVSITGDWGIPAVPADVKEAVLIAIDNATSNPEAAVNRTFGALTVTEDIDTSFEGTTWRALPGESRALLTPYRIDVPAVFA